LAWVDSAETPAGMIAVAPYTVSMLTSLVGTIALLNGVIEDARE
jgi:hypothetical protein